MKQFPVPDIEMVATSNGILPYKSFVGVHRPCRMMLMRRRGNAMSLTRHSFTRNPKAAPLPSKLDSPLSDGCPSRWISSFSLPLPASYAIPSAKKLQCMSGLRKYGSSRLKSSSIVQNCVHVYDFLNSHRFLLFLAVTRNADDTDAAAR